MSFLATVCRLLLVVLCASAGCALPADGKRPADQLLTDPPTPAAASGPGPSGPATDGSPPASSQASEGAASRPAAASAASAKSPDPRVLDDVLAELATLGPMQPEAQQRLIDDLRKTDPAYWPMLVQTFRASLAYRRRAAERAAGGKAAASAVTESLPVQSEAIQVAATEPVRNPLSVESPAIEPSSQAVPPQTSSKAAGPEPLATPAPNTSNVETTAAASKPAINNSNSETPWRQHLSAAIGELERQTHDRPNDPETLANQVYLRLLDVTAGRRDDALRPIPGIPPAQQEYWSQQLFALSTYLDSQRIGEVGRRAAEAGMHLSRAVTSLSEQGPLVVRNLAFCTEVRSYGVLKRFEPAEFKAAQHVLLYAEVENFKSEESAHGFHTSLGASYQILDSQGRRVAHDELPLTEEDCQNRRRDFFVSYLLTLPKTIYEGTYTFELTIEDKLAHKIGTSPVGFTVKATK